MTDETLNRIRTAINAEIEELHCNSGEHSYDVQVNAIMIAEGLRRALCIVEEIFLKDGETQSRIERVLSGKTPEEQYDILYWLMMEYGKGHSNSRLARIEWMKRKDGDHHEG